MKKPSCTNLRSPIAKARDDWRATPEFAKLADPTTLGAPAQNRQYLENRLIAAFFAGMAAEKKLRLKSQIGNCKL